MPHPVPGYTPIRDYGAIGNLRSVALVSKQGSIDWCSLPRVDAPSVFAALLDRRKGGRFRVSPVGRFQAQQRYLRDTNVLETRFDTEGGRLVLTDFMPLSGDLDGCGNTRTDPEIHRVLRAEGGSVGIEVEWSPRFDYARATTAILPAPGGWLARGGGWRLALGGLPVNGHLEDRGGPTLLARFRLAPGDPLVLSNRWDCSWILPDPEVVLRDLEETVRTWRAWVRKPQITGARNWAADRRDLVVRSELALKLLTDGETGAFVAAPTTSLPETPGGVRNWDYRFSWIRDASLTAQAMAALGHKQEARDFLQWAEQASERKDGRARRLQILYRIDQGARLTEEELPQLEGYGGARPVRIGNEAAEQLQLDIYGELLTAAYELHRMGADLPDPHARFLSQLADRVCESWRQPDHGLWEVRGPKRHYVHSKLLCWAALSRAVRLAEVGLLRGDRHRWHRARNEIGRSVLTYGWNPRVEAFTIAYGEDALDAANLLLPIHELIGWDDPRMQATIDRVLERLTVDGLVYRYRMDDGLPGEEGAFALCTFWMVDALALSGRLDEAHRIFEAITSRVNHLGLLSEQIDPHSNAFLGNFPQAFSHIGLINSSLYLAHAEGRHIPLPPLLGTAEHRQEVRDHDDRQEDRPSP